MPTVILSPIGGAGQQFFDNNGNPLNGGLLYTYAAGGTTSLTSYTTAAGNVANANPIVLDLAGRVPVGLWLVVGLAYKIALKTSADVQLGVWDNITLYPGTTTAQAAAIAASTVLAAAIGNTACFVANALGGQSITRNVLTKITFPSKIFDLGTNWSTVNSRFTAPATGLYFLTAEIEVTKSTPVVGENFQLSIITNGSFTVNYLPFQINNVNCAPTPVISQVLNLTLNDYVELWGTGSGAAGGWTSSANELTKMSIFRIS